ETTVGSLRLHDASSLQALADLNVRLCTTNYDDLIEQANTLPTVTFTDADRAQRVLLRGDREGVVHLHGHWAEPSTVVLGTRSYDRLRDDARYEGLRKCMAFGRTLVFIGVGDGNDDPDWALPRGWMTEALRASTATHYRLCLASELERLRAEQDA